MTTVCSNAVVYIIQDNTNLYNTNRPISFDFIILYLVLGHKDL